MDHLMTCKCGEVLVKSHNGTTKVRGKIFIFKNHQGYVVCKGCGVEQPVPLKLEKENLADPSSKSPKLFVSGGVVKA